MNEPMDLSAFPILRIDQISIIDSDCLERSLKEINELLKVEENENPAMYRYLVKQYDLMRREIDSRQAVARVESLLRGIEDPLNRKVDVSFLISPRLTEPTLKETGKRTKEESKPKPTKMESEVIKSSMSDTGSAGFSKPSSIIHETPMPATRVHKAEVPIKVQPAIESVSFPLPRDQLNSETKALSDTEHLTPRSTHSSHSNRSSRRSQHNDPSNNPSKKSIEVVYKNFGNEFIVAATEKKKRFYPAKKNTESIEEIKNRERNERRKQAMQRLLQRKERRELQMQKMREKKRTERIEQQKRKEAEEKDRQRLAESTTSPEAIPGVAPTIIESSDSESVSGGDDDDLDESSQLQITENMVEAAKNILPQKEVLIDWQKNHSRDVEEVLDGSGIQDKVEVRSTRTEDISNDKLPIQNSSLQKGNVVIKPERKRADTVKKSESIPPKRNIPINRKGPTVTASSSSAKVSREKPLPSEDTLTKRRKTIPTGEEVTIDMQPGGMKETSLPVTEKQQTDQEKLDDPPMETELAAKNLAALSTIRRLKQMKQLDRSKSSSEIIDSVSSVAELQKQKDTAIWEVEEIKSVERTDAVENTSTEEIEEKMASEEGERISANIGSEAEEVVRKDFDSAELLPTIRPEEVISTTEDIPKEAVSLENKDKIDLFEAESPRSVLPLFEKQDGYYCCNYDPEQLPGLLAWKPEPVSRGYYDWKIHLSHYHPITTTQQNEIFEYRAAKRRQIPYGLIQLALACQEILLGIQSVEDEDDFLAAWMVQIANFDERAAEMTEEEERVLFLKSWVCGNGFMVCKKLEDLIKDVFSQRTATATATAAAPPISVSSSGSIGEEKFLSRPSTVARESMVSRLQTRSSSLRDSNNTDSLLELPPLLDKQLLPQADNITRELDDDENDGREEVSDDEEKLPDVANKQDRRDSSVEEVFRTEEEKIPSATTATPTIVEESNDKTIPRITTDSRRVENSVGKRNGRNPPVASVPRSISSKSTPDSSTAITTTSTFRLIDYYPNFAMIFPVAYHQLGNARDSDPSTANSTTASASARILIETMHIQSKLYQEWLEIMRDYSTVFCSEDNPSVMNPDGMERSAAVYEGKSNTLHYRVKSSRPEVSNIITDVFSREGVTPPWIALPSGLGLGLTWNLLWTWSKPRINKEHLVIWQKVNHFEDSKQLTRKDLLKKNLQRFTGEGIKDHSLQQKYGQEFEIMPQTFLLPQEYTQFISSYKEFEALKTASLTTTEDGKSNKPLLHNYWILKPVGLSRGRGISLIQHLSEVVYSQASVIQKYIERPLCLQHYKFDLRLFIVVTSFKPLEAFIYRDGFARVSTHAYTLDTEALQNKFIHLTNSSIQKQNHQGPSADNPLKNQENDPDTGGSKIALLGANGLWKRLEQLSQGKINVEVIWQRICLLVVKSLVAVDDKMIYQPNSFELFGYDILIDEDLRPWLLEVNASPSLARDNALDTRIKNVMIKDLIHLLDVAPYDRAALSRVITKRLQQMTTKPARGMKMNNRNDVELEKDLREILGDYQPRRYGELPKRMGNYERLAPETNYYQQVMKIKKKLFRSANNHEE